MKNRLEQLRKFLEETPHDPFLKYAHTMELLKLGDDEQAGMGFEDLISNHEDYVGTYYHYGKFLDERGQNERALEIYEKGMAVAQEKRNFHALGELKNAHLMASGLFDEEE